MSGPEWVTTPEQRAGLLVAVVTGGRPTLKQRPTAQFLGELRDAGFPPPVWVLSDRDAGGYERDEWEHVVYPHAWAVDYARAHWMRLEPPDPTGFVGAFPGREWACREAERRGCWGVLQLDDNVTVLRFMRGTPQPARALLAENGGAGMFGDLLTAVSLSTNVAMLGAQLDSVSPSEGEVRTLVRPGFPYSWFVEKTGPGREPWFGPYEDDITHALQYGDRYDGVTAAVLPAIKYRKESGSRTGMRARYDHTRAVQLQRLMPQAAKIGVRATKSNGRGGPRVFHTMTAGAIRNPVVVADRELYARARLRMEGLVRRWYELELEANRVKMRRRIAKHAETAQ